jgi:serine/threonine-protein kinase
MNHPIPSIVNSRADVPQSVENVVIKATAKKLENRYKSADEFLEDLATVFDKKRYNEDKKILENDTLEEDRAEKTVIMSKEISKELIKKAPKKKPYKKVLITIAITMFSCMLIFASIIYVSRPIEMPSLKNLSSDEATGILKGLGITDDKIIVKNESSKDVEVGKIVNTVPDENGTIDDSTEIILFVSTGPEKEIMTDFTGLDGEVVKSELQSKGYDVGLTEENSATEYGKIISQNPPAGTALEQGQKIEFSLSTGTYSVKMENWISLKEVDIQSFVDENNLEVDKKYECNDSYGKDLIFKQSPSVNSEIRNGSTVKIYVSEGACPVEPEKPAQTITPKPEE